MQIVKTWKLSLDPNKFTEEDFEYLRGCCRRIDTRKVDFPNLLDSYTKQQISMHTKIIVETVNEEQESALLLKYANDANLLTVETDTEIRYTFDGMYER